MKIYTRRGDRGESGLLSGERLSKDDLRFQAVGALDEIQSQLGVVRALTVSPRHKTLVYAIQKSLFVAGTELAVTSPSLPGLSRRLGPEDTRQVETWIDELSAQYGLPGRFVVPGRSLEGAAIHVARSVCRRCERSIVALNRQDGGTYADLIAYFNRLSDLFFVVAWSFDVRKTVEQTLSEVLSGALAGATTP